MVFGIGLALTSGSLAALDAPGPATRGQAAELRRAGRRQLAATVLRFLLFRAWVFRGARDAHRHVPRTTSA